MSFGGRWSRDRFSGELDWEQVGWVVCTMCQGHIELSGHWSCRRCECLRGMSAPVMVLSLVHNRKVDRRLWVKCGLQNVDPVGCTFHLPPDGAVAASPRTPPPTLEK